MHEILGIVTGLLVMCICASVRSHTAKEPAVPLCLPKEEGEKTLQLQREGIDVLKKIGNKPVVVICIAGPARTGKSYFLSKLSDNANFEVGHGMDPRTTGIWISANAEMVDKEGVKARLVLLDTEGIGSIVGDKETMDRWDTSIVSLCTLTSSVLIYNSNGIPSYRDLQKLHFFSMFGNAMGSVDNDLRSGEALIWLIQGNTPKLKKYPDWTTFFEREVFEDTNNAAAPNEIIAGIKKMFPKFHAIAIPAPSINSTIREDLDNDEYKSELNPFFTEVNNAAKQILKLASIKYLMGERMSGSRFLELLTSWVDKINVEGSKFSWINGFEVALGFRCEDHIKECKSKFKHVVNRISLGQEKDCMKRMRELEEEARNCFGMLKIPITSVRDEFLAKLMSFVADEKHEVLKKWAKIQVDKLLQEHGSKTDLIDWQNRGTKLSYLLEEIADIDEDIFNQFELRDIAQANPEVDYWEMVKSELEKKNKVIIKKWMDYHFNEIPGIHEGNLADIGLDRTLSDVKNSIEYYERNTISHFYINDMEEWPLLKAKLDELKLKLVKYKKNTISAWKRVHRLDGMNSAIKTTIGTGVTAGGLGFAAFGPLGAIMAATASIIPGGGWAIYEYFTADDDPDE